MRRPRDKDAAEMPRMKNCQRAGDRNGSALTLVSLSLMLLLGATGKAPAAGDDLRERPSMSDRAVEVVSAITTGPSSDRLGAVSAPRVPIPYSQIPPGPREEIAEVTSKADFHQRSETETFPCDPRIYLSLVNDPALTLALWEDLRESPAWLRQVTDESYEGSDGASTSAIWEFLHRSPTIHILIARMVHAPAGVPIRLEGRVLLIVRTEYLTDERGVSWIRHDIEAFVRIDTPGWRPLARVVRPLVEDALDGQIREALLFVSAMGRLVESYPDWAGSVVERQSHLPGETRNIFGEILAGARLEDAQDGPPPLGRHASRSDPGRIFR